MVPTNRGKEETVFVTDLIALLERRISDPTLETVATSCLILCVIVLDATRETTVVLRDLNVARVRNPRPMVFAAREKEINRSERVEDVARAESW